MGIEQNSLGNLKPGLRIRELRNLLNMPQKAFAQHLKVSQSTLSQIENGHHYPSFESLSNMVIDLDINSNWIVSGTGSPFQHKTTGAQELEGIPLVSRKALAGYGDKDRSEMYLAKLDSFAIPGFESFEDLRMFQALGDSMEPTLHDQDFIVGHACTERFGRHIGQVHVAVLADKLLVKRLEGFTPETGLFVFSSDNPKYKTIEINRSEILEIWVVNTRLTHQLTTLELNHDYRIKQLEAAYEELKTKIDDLNP